MSKGLRVLFVNHTGEMGGAEKSLVALLPNLPVEASVMLFSSGPLVKRLQDQNISVTVITGAEKLFSLGRETALWKRLLALRHLPRLLRALTAAAREVDVVYINSKKALFLGALAARNASRPFIWHQRDEVHLPANLPLRARLSESLLIFLLNRYATRVISVSRACADNLIAAGARPDLPVTIYNGFNPFSYTEPVDRKEIRRLVGVAGDTPLVGCFGRMTEWKGQSVLINALMDLPKIHIVLVGGGIFGESGYEAKLHAQVARLGLTQRVHFLGHREDVPALMRSVDVVVHTSTKFEPFGRVIVEAMLCERPVIATAVGGVPEIIENGVNGLLVPPNDPQALAEAIEYILSNRVLAKKLAAAGRERALRCFNLDRVVREVQKVIESVVN